MTAFARVSLNFFTSVVAGSWDFDGYFKMCEFVHVRVLVINYSYGNALAAYFLEMNHTIVGVLSHIFYDLQHIVCSLSLFFFSEIKKTKFYFVTVTVLVRDLIYGRTESSPFLTVKFALKLAENFGKCLLIRKLVLY